MSLFKVGDNVLHIKSGHEYVIEMTPEDNVVIEASAKRAYMYRRRDEHAGQLYVRPECEMEDGRFKLIIRTTKRGGRR